MNILVAGLINIETTLKIDGFPIAYDPVRYPFGGVNSTVSGVGYNLAKSFTRLGNEVNFLAMIGKDLAGQTVMAALEADRLPSDHIRDQLSKTPQSVILFDGNGKRAINVDLKDIQEQTYPPEIADKLLRNCDLAALCNINFSRPMLKQARGLGKWVATDVHALSDLTDDYNRDYMAAADILFLSDERIPTTAEDFARQILNKFGNEIVVIGMGGKGALMAVRRDGFIQRFPAVYTRPVVNTIGAGDALFSSFLHFYLKTHNPYEAIRLAIIFASYKIGTTGAAEGFLTEEETLEWQKKVEK
ncbi:MAG TPA: carbohydrate kinase family protein [Anaerolineaceae bacterium]|nr:carbohydrate kinase family protein [Anaerolineaceae bacterium]HPN52723.1 carbohydrate kinase family protein [Anaerolineaceae bacterium]